MEFLYGLDALLGVVVSLATLIGFLTMRAGSQVKTQAVDSSTAPDSRRRRRFPLMTVLVVIAMAVGGWAYLRSSPGARDALFGDRSGASRYDRLERRKMREERRERLRQRREHRERRESRW